MACLIIDMIFALILLVMAGLTETKFTWLAQLAIVTAYFYHDVWLVLYAVYFNM
jgi:hypothetical protein